MAPLPVPIVVHNAPLSGMPVQDQLAGLGHNRLPDGRWVTKYDATIALRVVERIAAGELLKDILQEDSGLPHRSTFHRWVVTYPELNRAYMAARELSASAFEEEAIGMARAIREEPGTGTKVRAYEVAMNQFRWSATRRDPAKFAEHATTSIRVPIQINTVLDLGQGDTVSDQGVYELTATVVEEAATPIAPEPEKPLVADPGDRGVGPGRPRWKKQLAPRIDIYGGGAKLRDKRPNRLAKPKPRETKDGG